MRNIMSLSILGRRLAPLFLLGGFSTDCAGEIRVIKTDDSRVDSRALTIDGNFGQAINGKSFQQDAVLSHQGWQYVGYYDEERRVALARRRLPAGAWQTIRFPDYMFKSNDAHNTISIGICPGDGTIHLAWDHHAQPLHYRISSKHAAAEPDSVQWTPDLFGPIRDKLERGVTPKRLTYPRFLQTLSGGLQLFYREGGSGNGDRFMVDYDPSTGGWRDTRQIDSGRGLFRDEEGTSDSRCSYPNGYTYGPNGRLHATWVWREDSEGANHDLVYAYSDDQGRRWRSSSGSFANGPVRVDTPGASVVAIPRSLGLMNTHGQAVDSQGRIHTVVKHCTDESIAAAGGRPGQQRWGPNAAQRYVHYWRDHSGVWQSDELPSMSGNRPKLFADRQDNLFLILRDNGRQAEDEQRGISGDLVVMAASSASAWSDWRIVHTEPGPFGSEMLGDPTRWASEGVLSVLVQGAPERPHQATELRILSFRVEVAP